MQRKYTITCVLVLLAMALAALAALAAGGGVLNNPQETYTNSWTGTPTDRVVASVTVQFVSYELNSIAGKYKLIPILLSAAGRQAPVALSIEQDRLIVISDGKRVAASLQLSSLDRTMWDSLPPETQNWLIYPEQLKPDSSLMVYAFVPLAELKGRPKGFEYTIKSLPAPLLLQPEAKKGAAALPGKILGVTRAG
jgi:hypothetical protein